MHFPQIHRKGQRNTTAPPAALPLGELARSAWEGKGADGEAQTRRWHRSDKGTTYRCAAALGRGACPLRHCFAMPQPGLRLPASASLSLASCWPLPQQLLPVSAAGGGRRRCSQRERLSHAAEFSTSSPPSPIFPRKKDRCISATAFSLRIRRGDDSRIS